MTGEAREQLRRGKPALVGFDRKIEIDWTFLESLQQADISRRAYASAAEHILILQGTEDEIVPFEAVRTFAERNGIAFVPVEGADHRFLRSGTLELAHAQILSFFGLK